MPTPKSKEELQRFLGMLTYLAKFIPNLSQVASPLRKLLEINIEWHWESDQEQRFKTLKQLAIEAPVLKFFDPNKPTKLSVDASLKGLGAVLRTTRRTSHYIRIKSPNLHPPELCPNRERNASNLVWMCQIP